MGMRNPLHDGVLKNATVAKHFSKSFEYVDEVMS
jgi:hypothetical protein